MAMRSEPKSRKRREVELLRVEKVRRSEHKHTANISVQFENFKEDDFTKNDSSFSDPWKDVKTDSRES